MIYAKARMHRQNKEDWNQILICPDLHFQLKICCMGIASHLMAGKLKNQY